MTISLSEISIVPIRSTPKGVVAFCNFVINNAFRVCDCAIATDLTNGGFRIIYPTKQIPFQKKPVQVFYPINKETGSQIQNQIIEHYNKIINKSRRENG